MKCFEMKKKTHLYQVHYLRHKPKIVCKLITDSHEYLSIAGNSIEEIYIELCTRFPLGIKTKGLVFVCESTIEAKKNFCALLSLGLQSGYFKEEDFGMKSDEPEDLV